MSGRPPVVALYGYFGMGNIGNEASFAAFLAQLRRHRPDVVVKAFVAGPDEVSALHHVPAERLMAYRAARGGSGVRETLRKVVGRVVDVPRGWRLVRDVDVLVVPGTGVLETQLMARPWGLPYWMFLATAACRARGGRVALVGVGAEPASHPVTRLLFRSTVRMATHVSVRDEASRDVVRSYGRDAQVLPDLAFALPVPPCPPARPGHVAIGVMAYEGAPDDPARGAHMVERYVDRLAGVVARLAEGDRSVVLVTGDVADLALAQRVLDLAVRHCHRVALLARVSRAETLEGLMAELAEAEVAVVSRFHNLVAALKVARPAVSLSYAPKSRALLEEFGLLDHVQPIDSFDGDLLLRQVEACRAEGPGFALTAKVVLQRCEDELRHYLESLVDDLVVGREPRPGRRRGQRHPGVLLPGRR